MLTGSPLAEGSLCHRGVIQRSPEIGACGWLPHGPAEALGVVQSKVNRLERRCKGLVSLLGRCEPALTVTGTFSLLH